MWIWLWHLLPRIQARTYDFTCRKKNGPSKTVWEPSSLNSVYTQGMPFCKAIIKFSNSCLMWHTSAFLCYIPQVQIYSWAEGNHLDVLIHDIQWMNVLKSFTHFVKYILLLLGALRLIVVLPFWFGFCFLLRLLLMFVIIFSLNLDIAKSFLQILQSWLVSEPMTIGLQTHRTKVTLHIFSLYLLDTSISLT